MKNLKKRWLHPIKKLEKSKKILLGAILSFLILMIGLVILGIRVNFLINDELTIKLTPLDKDIVTTYDKENNVSFQFKNENSFFCKSQCTYELFTLSNNSLLDSATLILPSKTTVIRNYTFIPSQYGSGQDIYSFQVTCHNIKTFVCATEESEYLQSSFLTLSYDLSEEEKTKVITINTALNSFLKRGRVLEKEIQELHTLLTSASPLLAKTLFKKEAIHLQEEFHDTNLTFEEIKNESTVMLELWNKNQYVPLSSFIKESNATITEGEIRLNTTAQDLSEATLSYNALASDLTDLVNNSSVLATILSTNRTNDPELEMKIKSLKGNISNLSISFFQTSTQLGSFKKNLLQLWREWNDLSQNISIPSNLSEQGINIPLIDTKVNITFVSSLPGEIQLKEPICCVFGECKPCCTTETCKSDPRLYPTIFLHGHAFNKKTSPETSLNTFAKMQKKLQEEGIIDAGQIDLQNLESIPPGEYGRSGNPISVRASYYYVHYYDIGGYRITTQKSERIENYALRLNEIINILKERTGASQVNIVAHSMGGLAAREYLRIFGDDSVHKIILMGTPDYGITGKTQQLCDFLGAQKECEDMSENSVFLKKLNQATPPQHAQIYTIAGLGCIVDNEPGDGLIQQKNVPLSYATNFNVTGACTDIFKSNFHDSMLEPDKVPEVYNIVKNILKENATQD